MKIIYHKTLKSLSRENYICLGNLLSECKETSHKQVEDVVSAEDYKSIICLYDDNEQICGFIALSEDYDNMIVVDTLFVEPTVRKKGYAKKLLHSVEKLCKKKDCSSIELIVEENNKIARNLYEKFGYVYGNFNPRNKIYQMTKKLLENDSESEQINE